MRVLILFALAIATVSAVTLHENATVSAGTLHENATVSAGTLHEAVPVKDMPKSIEGRITNGYPAYEGKVPYIVGLGFSSGGGGWWCGGSIIGNTWVLTAAHCTDGSEYVTINYGASWRYQPQYTHWVSRNDMIQHPHYNRANLNNDISLIRTPHVDFWHLVNKVELPSFNDRYNSYAGWWAVTSGWGATYDGSPLPDWLQCLDAQVIDNNQCRQTYGSTITDNTICIATPYGKSTCGGDSGGPLVTHYGNRLIGVTSFVSYDGCQSGAPAGFTRVTGHLDWIRGHTGIAYY